MARTKSLLMTEGEFDAAYRIAEKEDFELGLNFYTKFENGDGRVYSELQPITGDLSKDAQRFQYLLSQGRAYIKL